MCCLFPFESIREKKRENKTNGKIAILQYDDDDNDDDYDVFFKDQTFNVRLLWMNEYTDRITNQYPILFLHQTCPNISNSNDH